MSPETFASVPLLDEFDLHDYARPEAIANRKGAFARSSNTKARRRKPEISDDWPDQVPVSEAEIDLFDIHFGAMLDGILRADN